MCAARYARWIGWWLVARQGLALRGMLQALSFEARQLQAAHLADLGDARVWLWFDGVLDSAGDQVQLQAGTDVDACFTHPEATHFRAGNGDVVEFVLAVGVCNASTRTQAG